MKRVVFFIGLTFFGYAQLGCAASLTMDGQEIYEGRCAGICHQSPPVRALSKQQWQIVIDTMNKRMQSRQMEPLTDDERAALVAYLSQLMQ